MNIQQSPGYSFLGHLNQLQDLYASSPSGTTTYEALHISVSCAEMTREADVDGDDAHGQSHHGSIYSPVHTPAHVDLRKERLCNVI
jgi:hypothetical protein